MKKLNMIYEGKAKKVYKTDDEKKYIVEYKDDATAFNGEKRGTILGKGVVNNKMSASLFTLLEKEGVPTHHIELLSDRESLVKAVKILPLEVIVRNAAAGSLAKRLGLEEGVEMMETVLEFSYKNDELGDPMVNDYHIKAMGFATDDQLETVKKYALKVNEVLKKFFLEINIKLIDFKLSLVCMTMKLCWQMKYHLDTCRLWTQIQTRSLIKTDSEEIWAE